MENPNCSRCKSEQFSEVGIKYDIPGKNSEDTMAVVMCKNCGAIIGTPTRHLFDWFLQNGYKLEEILNMVSPKKTPENN